MEDAWARLRRPDTGRIDVNDISRSEAGFESDSNELVLVNRNKQVEQTAPTTKEAAAHRIIRAVVRALNG